jgi:prevent-host-death family protein
VGARELKQHTGEIMERVRGGERVLLTMRGEPFAVISPVNREAIEEAVQSEAKKAEKESLEALGWLTASEEAFSFWGNSKEEVRLRAQKRRPLSSLKGSLPPRREYTGREAEREAAREHVGRLHADSKGDEHNDRDAT